jgi:TP901 family phage tail tape measure protein
MYLESVGASQAEIDAQKQLAKHLKNTAAGLEASRRQAVRFSNALHTVSSSIITVGSGLVIAGGAGLAFFMSSINVARDYEQQVRKTATQVDNFTASLDELSQVGLDIANRIAVPFEEIQPALYNILSSTNANLEQATVLLEAFAKTAVAGQVSLEDAAKGTIPILNAFNIPLEDVNRILDIQFQLVRKGVGTYGEFASVLGRVVPSATRAGQNFEEVAAGLAYLTRNGLSAAMASSSFARALDAISNPTAVQNMENLGIQVRDVAGNMLPLEQILKGLRDKLDALPQADRVAALVDIFKGAGGTIQARRFLDQVLLRPGELEEFIGYLGDMKDSAGAFDSAYNEMSESVASQTELLRNKWKILQEAVGRILTPAFVSVIKWLQKVLDKFNELDPRTQKIIVILAALGAAFSIVAGLVLILLGILAGVVAAVVTAGAAFFYLIGAIALLVTGLGVLAAGFGIAWEKSEQFRNMIHDVRAAVERLWHEVIIPFAQEVKAAFDEHLAPALERFRAVLEEKVMPVARELYQMFVDKIIPAAKEVANDVKDVLAKAFEVLGYIIDNYVIPAIEKAIKYYNDHKETIDKLVGAAIWLAKWLLIIALIVGGVLAIAFGGPILAIFLAFGAVLTGIGMVFVWVYEKGQELGEWLKTAWDKIGAKGDEAGAKWEGFKTKVSDVWTSIKEVTTQAWDYVVDKFNQSIEYLKGLWQQFWEGHIGRLLVAIWEFIKGTVELAMASVTFVILWGLEMLKIGWDFVWGSIKDTITAVWDFIGPYVEGVWGIIQAVAETIWGNIKNFFTGTGEDIKNVILNAWDFITSWLSSKWSEIQYLADKTFTQIKDTIGQRINTAKQVIVDAWEAVKHFFTVNFGWMYDAGQNLINSFIDGISSRIEAATEKIKELAQKIRDHFPFSPAKTGPLSGSGSLYKAGQTMIRQLADGMNSQDLMVQGSSAALATNARGSILPAPGTGNAGRTVNQEITVNTQEINPVRQSAELGWLLAGRY